MPILSLVYGSEFFYGEISGAHGYTFDFDSMLPFVGFKDCLDLRRGNSGLHTLYTQPFGDTFVPTDVLLSSNLK